MREDFLEQGHDSTICFSQASNVSVDLIRSLGEAALQGSAMPAQRRGQGKGSSTRKQRSSGFKTRTALLSALATAPGAIAQSCIPLSGSTQCPAFTSASISTDSTLIGLFPFLQFVTSTSTFDDQLSAHVATSYVQQKYQTLLGCGNINLTNTTDLYARFTTSVICNAIIQNSISPCGLSVDASRPVCADTCAEFAQSEAIVVADGDVCSNPSANVESQIRADFTNCALPAQSLAGSCIDGATNEPENCGFGNSTTGLCQYCAAGAQNSTDTCCYNSKTEERCANVVLPTITGYMTFSASAPTATSTSSSSTSSQSGSKGLSGGAIAGIVIGSIAGLVLLVALIFLLIFCIRRRRGSQASSVFNQPSPAHKGQTPGMAYNPAVATNDATPEGYEVLPGGRIARMSALEGHSGDSPPRGGGLSVTGAEAAEAAGAYDLSRRRNEQSSSDEYSLASQSNGVGVLRPPPTGRRAGSLSSSSVLGLDDPQSPISGSGGDISSPLGLTSQQSEQLPFFKDYYSQDEIHPGDKVATLWAYQPRASDEFALERGDMLKVIGIWDDGWATGLMTDDRASEWDAKRNAQRDSGVSNTSGRRNESPPASGEIKAFPLVCVCLPDHWRKTIDGDGSTEAGSSAPAGTEQ
ncbi:SH3 domain-containing protein [Diplocarpon rosae]|nr:SH3 domain-containing protein [Diplocarpon rosae]